MEQAAYLRAAVFCRISLLGNVAADVGRQRPLDESDGPGEVERRTGRIRLGDRRKAVLARSLHPEHLFIKGMNAARPPNRLGKAAQTHPNHSELPEKARAIVVVVKE